MFLSLGVLLVEHQIVAYVNDDAGIYISCKVNMITSYFQTFCGKSGDFVAYLREKHYLCIVIR